MRKKINLDWQDWVLLIVGAIGLGLFSGFYINFDTLRGYLIFMGLLFLLFIGVRKLHNLRHKRRNEKEK